MTRRVPRVCGCGAVVPAGERCACRNGADRERRQRAEANRPSASARGYGSKWREARAAFLASHPVCAFCGAIATVVDHIVPHRGDLKLFWRRSNWQPLCASCHNGAKQSAERRGDA